MTSCGILFDSHSEGEHRGKRSLGRPQKKDGGWCSCLESSVPLHKGSQDGGFQIYCRKETQNAEDCNTRPLPASLISSWSFQEIPHCAQPNIQITLSLHGCGNEARRGGLGEAEAGGVWWGEGRPPQSFSKATLALKNRQKMSCSTDINLAGWERQLLAKELSMLVL